MEDEVFEKYFKRIDEIYFMFQDSGFFGDDVKKDKLKQILDEIWQDGYSEGFDKGLDKAWEIKKEATL